MTSRTRHSLSLYATPRRPATKRWNWWLAGLLIGSTVAVAACSAPETSEAVTGGSTAVAGNATAGPDEAPAAASTGRRGQSLDSDELIGLGELGLLPSLIQSLGTSINCDFDDALSTCQ